MVDNDHSTTEACYIFSPHSTRTEQRPSKRRKLSTSQDTPAISLPALFDGRESQDLAKRRLRIFTDLWTAQEEKLQDVLKEANAETIDHVCQFLEEQVDSINDESRIPVGFITAGLATSSTGSTLAGIAERYASPSSHTTILASLGPVQCPNLKTALKSIIQTATDSGSDEFDEEVAAKPSKGIRLLNYDLQILHDLAVQKTTKQVILHFRDSEAFDGLVLSDLIDVLSCWLDRIPFTLIFEVATSVELFQEKLSRHALSLMSGTVFEAKSSTEILDLLFRCATSPDESRFLWLGANASKLLLDRQTEHIQSAQGFITAMQYMYMLHFYHNPLSSLLCGVSEVALEKEHIQAVRGLKSFKGYIDDLKDERETSKANSLLKDDQYLTEHLEVLLQETRDSLNGLFFALEALRTIYFVIPSKSNPTWSTLYIRAMSGELVESTTIRELSLSLKKLPSDTMLKLLEALASTPTLDLSNIKEKLEGLLTEQPTNTPLRTEHDAVNSNVRTTVIAQKVSLSRSKATLSAPDAAYSKIVNEIDLTLRDFLTQNIIFPKELVLQEILVFDSKAACRDVLGPAPRQAMERALTSPHDYLACECCAGQDGLKATHPATALVYQLYLESGALINVADMWAAFQAIVIPQTQEEEEIDEAEQLKQQALFFRALAELKYLGMIRSSRKKADHVMKVRWKGL